MRIRFVFLFLVWLCLDLSFLEASNRGNKDNNNDGTTTATTTKPSNPSEKRRPESTKKKKLKKKQNAHVVLHPPTVYEYRPLSKTRRWLHRMRFRMESVVSIASGQNLEDRHHDHHHYHYQYNPRLAFEMGVLSGLSYWEFHKKDSPGNASGFALLPPSAPNKFRFRFHFHSQYYRTKLQQWCSSAIRESFPIAKSRYGNSNTTRNHHYRRRHHHHQQQQQEEESNNDIKKTRAGADIESNKDERHNNKHNKNPRYNFEYSFYNWHEPTGVKGVSFHDTDVLISTATDTLIISFAGTASIADVLTSAQTFEPANHSQFFEPLPKPSSSPSSSSSSSQPETTRPESKFWKQAFGASATPSTAKTANPEPESEPEPEENTATNTTKIQGSLHRGFLNAYSRVERGSVLRIRNTDTPTCTPNDGESGTQPSNNNNNNNNDDNKNYQLLPKKRLSARFWRGPIRYSKRRRKQPKNKRPSILETLDRRFGHCYANVLSPATGDDDNDNNNDGEGEEEEEEEIALGKDGADADASVADGGGATGANQPKTRKKKKKKRTKKKKKKKAPKDSGGCKVTDKADTGEPPVRLSIVLKELVESALANGYEVHVTGHSLGGALATLLVLDVLTSTNNNNEGRRDIERKSDNLHLWTYGAPQIADSLFWESLLDHSPELRKFLMGTPKLRQQTLQDGWRGTNDGGRLHYRDRDRHRQSFHRYVTLSDDGKVDAISEVAKNTLAAHKESSTTTVNSMSTESETKAAEQSANGTPNDPLRRNKTKPLSRNGNDSANTTTSPLTSSNRGNGGSKQQDHNKKQSKSKNRWVGADVLHGKVAQSLGGVSRGGEVTHFVEAHYLWTPDQQQRQLEQKQQERTKHLQELKEEYLVTQHRQQQQQQQQQQQHHQEQKQKQKQTNNEKDKDGNAFKETSIESAPPVTDTRSSVAAHSIRNYLMGISRESGPDQHPLIPDLPLEWLEFLEISSK